MAYRINNSFNRAPRVNPWSPLHDPPSPKATVWSSAWREGRHHAEADDNSIPPRINAGSLAKADELEILLFVFKYLPGSDNSLYLVGPCIYLDQLGVSHHSFQGIILHISVSP
jgi:hypothetical protein